MADPVHLIDNVPLSDIEEARKSFHGRLRRTPLLPLNYSHPDIKKLIQCMHNVTIGLSESGFLKQLFSVLEKDESLMERDQIYLKLENLQPIGSFKLRGACNAIAKISPNKLNDGVFTASAGNFAQGLAWNTQRMGIQCNVIVPDHAPVTKLSAIERLGGNITKVPFDKWWEVIETRKFDGMTGTFIHPVCDKAVIAGNGTIGLEIVEDLPDVDAIIVPFGGGGLSCGIASAVKALKPGVKVFACEVETAAPLKASLLKGKPTTFDYKSSFVDGMGGKAVLTEMWPLASRLLDDSIVVSLQETVDALKLMVEKNHVVAEGAGAATVAAALTGKAGHGNIVCIISGGNIDSDKLIQILQGKVPS